MAVEIVRRDGGKKFPAAPLRKIAGAILKLLKQDHAELSIALIGNAEIRRLNAQYRRKDYATDVLSFPVDKALPAQQLLLGDVVISVDKAKEQARAQGRTLDHEMITLLIHGIVHLLGYDHDRSANDARIMKRLEKKIYRALCDEGLIQV